MEVHYPATKTKEGRYIFFFHAGEDALLIAFLSPSDHITNCFSSPHRQVRIQEHNHHTSAHQDGVMNIDEPFRIV